MRIRYRYKEYKDFPEATEISKERERRKANLEFLLPFEIIFTICMIIVAIIGMHPLSILLSIFLLLSTVYSVYTLRHYDKRTEDKINKVISDTIKEKAELEGYLTNSKYQCKNIVHKKEFKNGKCLTCHNLCENLEKCRIKNNVGTREIFICKECIANFEANCK